MRISCSLGSLLSIDEVLDCAGVMAKTNTEAIWIPETWGMECFSLLSAVASRTKTQKIGSSIINIYSRSPAVTAMGAASIDTLSGGRFILGLGTSSVPIVEEFHGCRFDRPLQRMREYVEIIRLALAGGKINYSGKIFELRNFSLLIRPQQNSVPIYLAAINSKMIELAWGISDGVILYLRPKDEMKQMISKMQAKRKIDVTCQIITCVSEDSEMAIKRAKKTISFYVAVGRTYREFLEQNGFEKECGNIYDAFKESGQDIHEHVPDSMVRSLSIAGTPDECRAQLTAFRDTGVDLPILQFNPVGRTADSFDVLRKTFLE